MNDADHGLPALEAPAWQGEIDKLPRGAAVLLSIALQRVDDVKKALEEGRFTDADHHIMELRGKVGPLAQAEATLGSFAERTSIIRARDLREGMHVFGWGDVSGVSERHCEQQAGESHMHVVIQIEGEEEPREVADIQELMVKTQEQDLTGPSGAS